MNRSILKTWNIVDNTPYNDLTSVKKSTRTNIGMTMAISRGNISVFSRSGHDPDFDQSEMLTLYYKPHGQWKLIKPALFTNAYRSFGTFVNYSDKILHLRLERDPKFYNYLLVAPAMILYLLSPLVFLLPVESGEKMQMCITLLLSQIVSVGAVAEFLPPSSSNFPKFGYVLGLSVLQMGIQTLLTILG